MLNARARVDHPPRLRLPPADGGKQAFGLNGSSPKRPAELLPILASSGTRSNRTAGHEGGAKRSEDQAKRPLRATAEAAYLGACPQPPELTCSPIVTTNEIRGVQ
jgi:hypothetical protein